MNMSVQGLESPKPSQAKPNDGSTIKANIKSFEENAKKLYTKSDNGVTDKDVEIIKNFASHLTGVDSGHIISDETINKAVKGLEFYKKTPDEELQKFENEPPQFTQDELKQFDTATNAIIEKHNANGQNSSDNDSADVNIQELFVLASLTHLGGIANGKKDSKESKEGMTKSASMPSLKAE